MSRVIWKEQSDKWAVIEGDWQGRWNIIDAKLENEIERVAGVISWIFLNMSKGYARRFRALDILKKRYEGLVDIHEMVVDSWIETDCICLVCGDILEYPDYDERYDCGCPPDKQKAAKAYWEENCTMRGWDEEE